MKVSPTYGKNIAGSYKNTQVNSAFIFKKTLGNRFPNENIT